MAEIKAVAVKQLRDRTGAGMMDCKNALVEADGDEEKAVAIIQKKGLAKAAKKAGAIAAEGVIHCYSHPGARLGVLVEINSQTDFVSRSTEFLDFVELVGLQIASMAPEYVRREEIPAADVDRQKKLFVEQLDEEETKTGKKRPEQARAKILEGKLDKWMSEKCVEEQPSVREHDEGKTIKHLSDALTAKIGEKIAVRRFSRFELGEGIAKVKADLAADVAALVKGS